MPEIDPLLYVVRLHAYTASAELIRLFHKARARQKRLCPQLLSAKLTITLSYPLLDEAANAEKAGLVEVKRQHPNYDFNTLNELAQLKH